MSEYTLKQKKIFSELEGFKLKNISRTSEEDFALVKSGKIKGFLELYNPVKHFTEILEGLSDEQRDRLHAFVVKEMRLIDQFQLKVLNHYDMLLWESKNLEKVLDLILEVIKESEG